MQPVAEARRARERERPSAPAHQMRVEQEERQAAEMIAMQVAHQHRLDAVGLDAETLERDQRGRPAIDQEARFRCRHQEAGVIPAAAAEGVAAAEKANLHRLRPVAG